MCPITNDRRAAAELILLCFSVRGSLFIDFMPTLVANQLHHGSFPSRSPFGIVNMADALWRRELRNWYVQLDPHGLCIRELM